MLLRKMTGEILMVKIFLAAEKSTLKAFTGFLRYGCVYIYIHVFNEYTVYMSIFGPVIASSQDLTPKAS